MKKIIALFALALALPVAAQTYGTITPSLGSTFDQLSASATSNLTVNIDCRKQQNTAVHLRFAQPAAGVVWTNLIATFNKSLDGTTFSTVASDKFTWTIALGDGTNMVYATTNFTPGGIGYYRLESLENRDATNYVTNIVFSYALKIRAN